ncbi:MAG TPA: energy transducer TonB [Rudaea sp.]|nr:energy transducer TonB [Rudaea sp.]
MPGSSNGHPSATQTRLFVDISLIPTGGDTFRIRVNHAHTGGWLAHLTPPKYPTSAITSHHEGKVIVQARYDGNGKIMTAELSESSVGIDRALVQAAIDNVRQRTYKPELVDGRGVPGAVLTPFCFTLQLVGSAPPTNKCKWSTAGKYDDLADGESFALNPAVKLETDVEGKFL